MRLCDDDVIGGVGIPDGAEFNLVVGDPEMVAGKPFAEIIRRKKADDAIDK